MGVQHNGKLYARQKPAKQSEEHQRLEKAARFKADQLLHLAIQEAIEDITNLIDKIAEEHNKSFDEISSLVHLGGHVLKQRRAPTIQNALSYCWARISDGRCELYIFFSRRLS